MRITQKILSVRILTGLDDWFEFFEAPQSTYGNSAIEPILPSTIRPLNVLTG